MHTPKNGFFYNLDRKTGELISAEPYVPGITWASRIDMKTGRPVTNPAAEYDRLKKAATVSPGEGGGHSWQPTAFSPKTGYFYLQATAHSSARHLPRPRFEYIKGLDAIGTYHFAQHAPGEAAPNPDPKAQRPESYLLAWDPVAQKAAWKTPGNGSGVLATAGGLVFQGHSRNVVMGELTAYRADTGELMAGPVSYSVDGEQYILATSGAGGGSIIAASPDVRERQVGRLVAFKLNGTATLPADPPPARPLVAITETLAPAAIETGKDLYLNLCARCHGLGTRSANVVPDLRRSPALVDRELWRTIVEDGALQNTGMIAWKSFLPAGGAEAIRAYVADETRKLQQVQSGP
jgi:quinohemoprotein ethanol dehydrogenase